MKTSKRTTTIAIAAVGLAALLTCAKAAQPLKIDFSDETVGAEPKSFVSVVGVWRIENDGNNKVLVVDGGSRDKLLPASPTRRARCTGTAMPNFSTAFRLTPISPMWWPRM